jgi:hypothetical protein
LADKIVKVIAIGRMDIIVPLFFASFVNPIIQQRQTVHCRFRKDVCLKICTDEGWATHITNCCRYGDNTETKANQIKFAPQTDFNETELKPAKNSFQSFSKPPRIRNTVLFIVPSSLKAHLEQ